MLVLSRRAQQHIRFPSLGISLQILKIEGSVAKIGIEAPPEIPVIRGELQPLAVPRVSAAIPSHRLRNRLNSVYLAVALLQKQIDAGGKPDVQSTLQKLTEELARIDALVPQQENDKGSPETPDPSSSVLIVEDEANERELLAGLLRMSGYRVDTVRDGVEALEYLGRNKTPDFVLLDMSMPRCSGPETITMIRQNVNYQHLRVFAVSGRTAGESGVGIGPAGVDDWFQKPLNPNRLLDRIRHGSAAS